MKILKRIQKIFFPSVHESLMTSINRMQTFYKMKINSKNKIAHKFFSLLVYLIHKRIFHRYACDITPGCSLGDVMFRHPLGIVIGGGAQLSNGVIIHQNVTFGALHFDPLDRRGIPCSQIVGENTILCAGSKILGDIKIGKNCIIGENAIVTRNIPDNCTVVGFNKILINT